MYLITAVIVWGFVTVGMAAIIVGGDSEHDERTVCPDLQ
jgi:hypothetical protein